VTTVVDVDGARGRPFPLPTAEAACYALLVLSSVALVWVASGLRADTGAPAVPATPRPAGAVAGWHLLAAIGGIALVCCAGGAAARRLGQPAVLGELTTAVLIGPSVLGAVAPGLLAKLLPGSLLDDLDVLASVGVALFAFSLGADLDFGKVRERTRAAVWISHASIAVPFVSGCFLAVTLTGALGPRGPFTPFCLFLGAAMSITAFPVLGRILVDTRLVSTPIGELAIVSAAVDDLTAWLGLSLVVAIARGDGAGPTVVLVAQGCALACALLIGARRLLAHPATARVVATAAFPIGFALVAAGLSEWIGLHIVFGAFVAGCAMPRTPQVRAAVDNARPMVDNVLLPLFFVTAGLQVDLRRLADHPGELWTGLAILVVAVAAKLGAAAVAARLTGFGGRDALAIGVLMNTRGLTELVVLQVGLDLGVLGVPLYSLLVVMALTTTAMATPLLALLKIAPREAKMVIV
jgi:Kef-type K+ transport system membrane component KefB